MMPCEKYSDQRYRSHRPSELENQVVNSCAGNVVLGWSEVESADTEQNSQSKTFYLCPMATVEYAETSDTLSVRRFLNTKRQRDGFRSAGLDFACTAYLEPGCAFACIKSRKYEPEGVLGCLVGHRLKFGALCLSKTSDSAPNRSMVRYSLL